MTPINQRRVLSLIEQGVYRVDTEQGCVYTFNKKNDAWERLNGALIRKKYRQIPLFLGAGMEPETVYAYEHYIVYLAAHGEFPKNMKVAWKDKNTMNNKAWNLELTPRGGRDKRKFRRGGTMEEYAKEVKLIRYPEIKIIKECLAKGGMTTMEIALKIQRSFSSVARAIKLIKAGIPMKYEQPPNEAKWNNTRAGSRYVRELKWEEYKEAFFAKHGVYPAKNDFVDED